MNKYLTKLAEMVRKKKKFKERRSEPARQQEYKGPPIVGQGGEVSGDYFGFDVPRTPGNRKADSILQRYPGSNI